MKKICWVVLFSLFLFFGCSCSQKSYQFYFQSLEDGSYRLTAISGAMVILRTSKYARRTKKQKEAADEKEIL